MLTINLYERSNRRDVSDLLFFSRSVQIHLDWHEPHQWLQTDDAIVYLARDGQQLVGVLGACQPIDGASWVRLAAVENTYEPETVLEPLWQRLAFHLGEIGTNKVAFLILESWLPPYLSQLGFVFINEIITLRRSGSLLPSLSILPGLHIRQATGDDIPEMTRVDQIAFNPPWQMSLEDVTQGFRIAAFSTVAEYENHIVAYQLSTRYQQSGHLARLAVLPEMQGNHIGGTLLADLTRHFLRQDIRTVSVNTQATNMRSQGLYQRFGFVRTGFDLPVWLTEI